MPLHLQVEWQATLRTLDGTQTLVALWLLKLGIRRVSDGDLVLLGGNLDRLDLAKDHVGGGIASEKGGGQILDKQEECYLFCCLSVLYCVKSFDVGIQQQPVCMLVEHHELYR